MDSTFGLEMSLGTTSLIRSPLARCRSQCSFPGRAHMHDMYPRR